MSKMLKILRARIFPALLVLILSFELPRRVFVSVFLWLSKVQVEGTSIWSPAIMAFALIIAMQAIFHKKLHQFAEAFGRRRFKVWSDWRKSRGELRKGARREGELGLVDSAVPVIIGLFTKLQGFGVRKLSLKQLRPFLNRMAMDLPKGRDVDQKVYEALVDKELIDDDAEGVRDLKELITRIRSGGGELHDPKSFDRMGWRARGKLKKRLRKELEGYAAGLVRKQNAQLEAELRDAMAKRSAAKDSKNKEYVRFYDEIIVRIQAELERRISGGELAVVEEGPGGVRVRSQGEMRILQELNTIQSRIMREGDSLSAKELDSMIHSLKNLLRFAGSSSDLKGTIQDAIAMAENLLGMVRGPEYEAHFRGLAEQIRVEQDPGMREALVKTFGKELRQAQLRGFLQGTTPRGLLGRFGVRSLPPPAQAPPQQTPLPPITQQKKIPLLGRPSPGQQLQLPPRKLIKLPPSSQQPPQGGDIKEQLKKARKNLRRAKTPATRQKWQEVIDRLTASL